jgi:hypothetical protein
VVNPTGLPAGGYLAFSFFCSHDLSFDSEDAIVVALRDLNDTSGAGDRRIDIYPNETNFGAGSGAAATETVLDGTPPDDDYHVRVGEDPNGFALWKGRSTVGPNGERWDSIAEPVPLLVKACSWLPPTPNPTQVVTAVALPGNDASTFPLTVVSTGGFAASGGQFLVTATLSPTQKYLATVYYSGISGNTFTGCRCRGAGTIDAGAQLRYCAAGWSVELLLPTVSGGGFEGPPGGWINVGSTFGLYLNIIRYGRTPASGSVGYYSTQFAFPVVDPSTPDYLTGVLNETTAIPAWGTGEIPSLESPVGVSLAKGVRFHNHATPELSVGVRQADNPGGPLIDLIEGPTGTLDNWLVAEVDNTDSSATPQVKAEFRFANWGLPAAAFPAWAPANNAQDVHQNLAIPSGGSVELVSKWNHGDVTFPPDPGTHTKHLCVWVRLFVTNVGDVVNFVEGGVRRNINFEHLSELDREAEISGVGYPAPAGGKHDFLIVPHVRRITVAPAPPPPGINVKADDPGVRYVLTFEGLRRTGKTITVRGTESEIVDPAPGHFALVLDHDVAADVLTHQLTGAGITGGPGGIYELQVPHDGTVKVGLHVDASPPKTGGGGNGGGQPGGGCLAGIVKAIVELIRKLFHK